MMKTLMRNLLVPPLLIGLIPAVLLTIVLLAWWELIGLLLRLPPKPVRFHGGRYLGALPFAWALSGTLGLAALTAWALRGGPVKARFADMAEGCIAQLENIPRLREIGGLW